MNAPEALVPILDQTRTVGLVTLPGAFIGVLLGGGSTADAAAAQAMVLVGLIAAETIAVVVQRDSSRRDGSSRQMSVMTFPRPDAGRRARSGMQLHRDP